MGSGLSSELITPMQTPIRVSAHARMVCLGMETVPGGDLPNKKGPALLPGQHAVFDTKGPLCAFDQQ